METYFAPTWALHPIRVCVVQLSSYPEIAPESLVQM